jgi:hypothetical protein
MCNSLNEQIEKLTKGGNEGARRNRAIIKGLVAAGSSGNSMVNMLESSCDLNLDNKKEQGPNAKNIKM